MSLIDLAAREHSKVRILRLAKDLNMAAESGEYLTVFKLARKVVDETEILIMRDLT